MASRFENSGSRSEICPGKIVQLHHKWVRNNFSLSCLGEIYHMDNISSGNTDIGDEWEFRYQLELSRYPQVHRQLILTLCLHRCLGERILAKCDLTVLGTKNEIMTESTDKRFCKVMKKGDIAINWAIPEESLYPLPHNNRTFVQYDSLTIVCEIVMLPDTEKFITHVEKESKPIYIPKSRLSSDLESLFNSKEFGDFTFKFGDKELRAMKGILSARSSVFELMFKSKNWKENQENCVDIKDIEYEVFREMLFYIYTDKAPKLEEMPKRLLAAADKYQLKRLRTLCEKAVSKNITTENALEIYILSDIYRSESLKTRTVEFIGLNKTEILKSNDFGLLMESDGKRAREIIHAAVDPEKFLGKPKKLKT